MAQKTVNLGLILPALGEYFNRWNVPVNANFNIIDEVLGDLQSEVTNARGSALTLNDRMSVSLNSDGSLKAVPEVSNARSSSIYGSQTGLGADFSLDDRIEQGDVEVWNARQQLAALIDSVAWAQDDTPHNTLISGPLNQLTSSGGVVTLNGAVTNVIANINGYRQRVRTNKDAVIVGSPGTYYLYLDRNPNGEVVFTPPPSSGTTSVYTPTNKLCKYSATATNFVAAGVKAGDILEITAPGANANLGKWVIAATAADDINLTAGELRIVGEFNSANTGLGAQVIDPLVPTFGFTGVAHSKEWSRANGRIYIGRCVFDGANVTSVTNYAYMGRFSKWESVTLNLGSFLVTTAHNLGFIPKKVQVYASQANDFSMPLELLSTAEMTSGSVSLTPASPQSPNYTAPTLQRSVITRFTDTALEVKNATSGLFYKDFDGTTQTSGFLYIVVER